jgi:hypothetical protein
MRPNSLASVRPSCRIKNAGPLLLLKPRFDRFGTVTAVTPQGHRRDLATPRLLIHPRARNAKQLGYLIGRQQRAGHRRVPVCGPPNRICPK